MKLSMLPPAVSDYDDFQETHGNMLIHIDDPLDDRKGELIPTPAEDPEYFQDEDFGDCDC